MSFRIRSLDRSFCLARCSESGRTSVLCYSTEDGPLCYCYDGTFGGSCSPGDAGVSDAPSGVEGGFELYHLVADWFIVGFVVVICEVIWFCYCRRRLTGVPHVVDVDVELSDETDSWSILYSDDWEELEQSQLSDGDLCLPESWVVIEDVEMEDVTL